MKPLGRPDASDASHALRTRVRPSGRPCFCCPGSFRVTSGPWLNSPTSLMVVHPSSRSSGRCVPQRETRNHRSRSVHTYLSLCVFLLRCNFNVWNQLDQTSTLLTYTRSGQAVKNIKLKAYRLFPFYCGGLKRSSSNPNYSADRKNVAPHNKLRRVKPR